MSKKKDTKVMNLTTRIHIFLITLCITAHIQSSPIAMRSYSINTPREISGVADFMYAPNKSNIYGNISAALVGGTSFNPDQITHCLFDNISSSSSCCTQIQISGSQIPNRGAHDWLADYFGLPTDYQSIVRFDPRIRSIIADICGFWQFNKYVNGFSIRVHAPIAWARWDLNMHEMITDEGNANYNAGYFAPRSIKRIDLVDDFSSFMHGQTPQFQLSYLATNTINPFIIMNPITVSRISDNYNTMSKLADLRIILQYALLQQNMYHLSIGVVGAIPSGNAPSNCTIFDPVVGNGHHWELGGALNGHYTFWESSDTLSYYGIYADIQATHLFADTQYRSFNLCGKPNSKYMLAQKLGSNSSSNPHLGGSSDAGYEFKNEYTSVANLTNRTLPVSMAAQVEATTWINGVHDTCNWNIGYNFWYRSCEKYGDLDACSYTIPANTWALKGDASPFGFELSTDAPSVALAATQSKATIHAGTNNYINDTATDGGIDGFPPSTNPGIDNRIVAITNNGDPVLDFVTFDPIFTSTPPIFLSEKHVDYQSAQSNGLTHSLFASINYVWKEKTKWIPYVGLGAQAEWAPHSDTDNSNCDTCTNCAISQWNVWFKTGVEFN